MMQPLVERPLRAGGSVRDRLAACFSMATLKKWLPILGWLPRYNLTWLQMDLIAGATVGLTTVPQALAYAEVAGLPVQVGLYSAFMGVHLLRFRDVEGHHAGPHRHHVPAVLLLRPPGPRVRRAADLPLRGHTGLHGHPQAGFPPGLHLIVHPNLLGLRDIPQQFFLQVYYTFRSLPQARVGDAVLGLFCLVLLVSLTVMKRTLGPGSDDLPVHARPRAARGLVHGLATVRNALVVVTATCVAYSWELSGHHSFTITGETAQGLPPFQPPPFSETMANGTVIHFSEIAQDLGAGLAVIPLMGLLESIAIAKAFASQNDYRIDGNQELFATECGCCHGGGGGWARWFVLIGGFPSAGLTNIMGSFVSAYPVTGSFGRTAVNSQSGVCSPAGGVVTGVVVLLSLAFLMPLFCYIPKASLAAVIICAVAPMLDLCVVPRIWAVRRLDLLPFLVTFLLSFWQVSDHDILVIELNSGLNFPATEYISKVLYTEALLGSSARSVVLDCGHMSSLDVTVVEELRDLLRQFELRGAGLVFCGLSHAMLEVLLAAELPGLKHTESVEAALQALSAEPDQTEALLSK
ncbi:hypothetical protein COCON_G00020390 [Conger conger]|uniref:STAS domain-containing protein n=1 Tax=Conger conger TaxID=82655 RepID=A0A9Q1DWR0_CONCO|nr:hypothetical protein COCON_G00020390 [Conger conger]